MILVCFFNNLETVRKHLEKYCDNKNYPDNLVSIVVM